MASELQRLRIGSGFDVHAVSDGSTLRIGGVDVESPFSLSGHSDADVLLHAIVDALLGASAQGDIGAWFPDTDAQWKGADSGALLQQVWHKLQTEGWELLNVDCVVAAQRPKLRPYIDRMRERIAELLKVELTRVSVKATTTEKLGFVRREEGIAASAAALMLAPK